MYLTSAKTEYLSTNFVLKFFELNERIRTLRHDITDIIK